jgi:hypothetical protein
MGPVAGCCASPNAAALARQDPKRASFAPPCWPTHIKLNEDAPPHAASRASRDNPFGAANDTPSAAAFVTPRDDAYCVTFNPHDASNAPESAAIAIVAREVARRSPPSIASSSSCVIPLACAGINVARSVDIAICTAKRFVSCSARFATFDVVGGACVRTNAVVQHTWVLRLSWIYFDFFLDAFRERQECRVTTMMDTYKR